MKMDSMEKTISEVLGEASPTRKPGRPAGSDTAPRVALSERPHAYGNSAFVGSELEEMAKNSPAALANQTDPQIALQHEKPEHRIMLHLKLQGHSNVEIAELTGYTATHVGQVCRQPWFRARLNALLQNAETESFNELLGKEAANSFLTMVAIRDDEAASKDTRLRSAMAIMDRHFGKPAQTLNVKGEHTHSLIDIDNIDAELAKVEAQQNELLSRRN
jgi:hypothetical protein